MSAIDALMSNKKSTLYSSREPTPSKYSTVDKKAIKFI
jgi:hypothetical protein